jgi:hypothetical protein
VRLHALYAGHVTYLYGHGPAVIFCGLPARLLCGYMPFMRVTPPHLLRFTAVPSLDPGVLPGLHERRATAMLYMLHLMRLDYAYYIVKVFRLVLGKRFFTWREWTMAGPDTLICSLLWKKH